MSCASPRNRRLSADRLPISCCAALLLATAHCTADGSASPAPDGGSGDGPPPDGAAQGGMDAGPNPPSAGSDAAAMPGARADATTPGLDAAQRDDAAPPPSSDAATSDAAAPECDARASASGSQIDVRSGDTLAAALATAAPGDRIVVHAGTYAHETISDCGFDAALFIEAADNEAAPVFAGLELRACSHITIRGLHFSDTLRLDGASSIALQEVTLDPGTETEEAALHIHGQGGAGACHDITVEDSTLANGGRTVFILGSFAPAEQWNNNLRFARNDLTCGSHVCFQLSGARDTVIEHNRMHSTATTAVLTAGATRVQIRQNRFDGSNTPAAAAQIASPGMEWDNYDGVEHMISSAITIANNVVVGWATGVQLDAARDVSIVFNTIPDGTALRLNHRTPHDRSGNVILDGNSEIKLWNNILSSLSIAGEESRPSFESNNLVVGAGGGGTALISGDPGFVDTVEYELAATSPAVGAGLHDADTPTIDFDGRPRDDNPDLGARERGAMTPPACP